MLTITKPLLSSMARIMKETLLSLEQADTNAPILSHQECLNATISILGAGSSHEVLQALRQGTLLVEVANPHFLLGSLTNLDMMRIGAAQLVRLSYSVDGRSQSDEYPGLLCACLEIIGSRLFKDGRADICVVTRNLPRLQPDVLDIPDKAPVLREMLKLAALDVETAQNGMFCAVLEMAKANRARHSLLVEQYGITQGMAMLVLDIMLGDRSVRVQDASGLQPMKVSDFLYGFKKHADALAKNAAWDFTKGSGRKLFYSFLLSLTQNGITLHKALEVISNSLGYSKTWDAGNPARIVFRMYESLLNGKALADSMRDFSPEFFPMHEILLVETGERAGDMGFCLRLCKDLTGIRAQDQRGMRALLLLYVSTLVNAGIILPDAFEMVSRCDWTTCGDMDDYIRACAEHGYSLLVEGHDIAHALKDIYLPGEWDLFGPFVHHIDFSSMLEKAVRVMVNELPYDIYNPSGA